MHGQYAVVARGQRTVDIFGQVGLPPGPDLAGHVLPGRIAAEALGEALAVARCVQLTGHVVDQRQHVFGG